MPTLQVLEREPDQRTELLYKMGQNISDSLEKARMREIMKLQNEAALKNAQNDADKMRQKSIGDAWDFFDKAAQRVGPEVAFELTSKNFPDAIMSMLDRKGEVIKNYSKTAKEESDLSEAAINRAIAAKLGGGAPSGATGVPISVGVGMDGQADTNPRVGMLEQPGQATRSNVLFPKFSKNGAEIVFLDDATKEAGAITEAKKRAENLENLKSGDLTLEQTNAIAAYQASKSSIGRIMGHLRKIERDFGSDVGIDLSDPMFAEGAAEEVQGALNELKTQMPILFGRGANFTSMEKRLLDVLTQFRGQSTGGIIRGLQFVNDFAKRRYDTILGGRPAVFKNEKDFEMNEKLNAWVATAIEKKKSAKVIDAGIAQIRKQYEGK